MNVALPFLYHDNSDKLALALVASSAACSYDALVASIVAYNDAASEAYIAAYNDDALVAEYKSVVVA